MRAQVPRDGPFLRETLLTDGTFERFYAAVCPEVDREVASLGEGLLADGALVRFLAAVRPEVDREVASMGEGLLADGALVRFFAAVPPEVGHVVGSPGEGLLADGALVGFLAVVQADMPLERRLPRGVRGGIVRVGFLRAEGDSSGRRTTVSCVCRGAGARLPCSRRTSGGRSIDSRLIIYGRHAAAAAGRGRSRAVNDRLLQADQCLGGHINRRLVHWRLCLEHAMPVRRNNNIVLI